MVFVEKRNNTGSLKVEVLRKDAVPESLKNKRFGYFHWCFWSSNYFGPIRFYQQSVFLTSDFFTGFQPEKDNENWLDGCLYIIVFSIKYCNRNCFLHNWSGKWTWSRVTWRILNSSSFQKEKRGHSPHSDLNYDEMANGDRNDFNQNRTSSNMATIFQRQSNQRHNSSHTSSSMASFSRNNKSAARNSQKQNPSMTSSSNSNHHRTSVLGDIAQNPHQSGRGSNSSKKGKNIASAGQNKSVAFYRRAYFIPLLLALLAIIFALYISLSAEYVS